MTVERIGVDLLWHAVERWRTLVRLRREQFERLLAGQPPRDTDDYWGRRVASFYDAVRRLADPGPVVRSVLEGSEPGHRVLDVGGGFGPVAIPVALAGRTVTVVEPSGAMLGFLDRWAGEAGVAERITVVRGRWQDIDIPQHDLVVCSHVLYPIEDVVGFLEKLRAAAARQCLVVMRLTPSEPASTDLFVELHGEQRVPQPCFGDLCAVLGELDWPFTVAVHPSESTWSYQTLDDAVDMLAESLLAGSRPDRRARIREWALANLRCEDGRFVLPRVDARVGIAMVASTGGC